LFPVWNLFPALAALAALLVESLPVVKTWVTSTVNREVAGSNPVAGECAGVAQRQSANTRLLVPGIVFDFSSVVKMRVTSDRAPGYLQEAAGSIPAAVRDLNGVAQSNVLLSTGSPAKIFL